MCKSDFFSLSCPVSCVCLFHSKLSLARRFLDNFLFSNMPVISDFMYQDQDSIMSWIVVFKARISRRTKRKKTIRTKQKKAGERIIFNRICLREWSFQEKLAIQDQEALEINNLKNPKAEISYFPSLLMCCQIWNLFDLMSRSSLSYIVADFNHNWEVLNTHEDMFLFQLKWDNDYLDIL